MLTHADLVALAEARGMPLRTLEQVKATLAEDEARDPETAKAMARLMVKAGRLTDEAREYAKTYAGL